MSEDLVIQVESDSRGITSIQVGPTRWSIDKGNEKRLIVLGRRPDMFDRAMFAETLPEGEPTKIAVSSKLKLVSRVHCAIWYQEGRVYLACAKGKEPLSLPKLSSGSVAGESVRLVLSEPEVTRREGSRKLVLDTLLQETDVKKLVATVQSQLKKSEVVIELQDKPSDSESFLGTISLMFGSQRVLVRWEQTIGPGWKPLADELGELEKRWNDQHGGLCDKMELASDEVREIHEKVVRAATATEKARQRVLILGETGVGKTQLAECYHKHSNATGKFRKVDCSLYGNSSADVQLLRAHLFGAKKGAWTGLEEDRVGAVEEANGGVLFIDEVGELSLGTQTLLLTFLQNGTYSRLGETETRTSSARVVLATNQNLDDLEQRGLFRKDILFRIQGGFKETLPPLRERQDELEALLSRTVKIEGDDYEAIWDKLDGSAQKMLRAYPWPGNFREYETFRVRFPSSVQTGSINEEECRKILSTRRSGSPVANEESPTFPLDALLKRVERRWLEDTIKALTARYVAMDITSPADGESGESEQDGATTRADAEPRSGKKRSATSFTKDDVSLDGLTEAELDGRLQPLRERFQSETRGRGERGYLSALVDAYLGPLFVGWKATQLLKCSIDKLPRKLSPETQRQLSSLLFTPEGASIPDKYRTFIELRDRLR